MQIAKSLFFSAFLLVLSPAMRAEHEQPAHTDIHHHEGDSREDIKKDIAHHLLDAHDYHLFDTPDDHPVSFPLPVILVDNGLKMFMSSKFDHGHTLAEKDGSKYMLFHSKIYNVEDNIYLTEKKTRKAFDAEKQDSVDEKYTDTVLKLPYETFYEQYVAHHGDMGKMHVANATPLDFSITKNVFHIILISALLLWLFAKAARSYTSDRVPGGLAKFFEPIVIFVRDDIARPNIGEKHYQRYMNFLLTVFFFIWLVNLFGLTPLGVNITNSIAVTFALALITFLITQFSGKKDYWMHIFWMPGVPWPMKIVLAPIELLGVFIKPFALMIRLYANITAGHIVMMSLLGLIFIFKNWIGSPLSFGLAFAISILELLVAALQAYIFTMLSALYFGSAVAEHHEEH
jgi:F-type H+-transporting ATPase subunit a